ncbi:MAG TPA: hypothetical protein VF982_09865 [Anaerolineales bacterium]
MTAPNAEMSVECLRIPALSNRKRWAISLLATIASTYALDAVATAAGMILVFSGLMLGLDHGPLLLFLASTYVAWGAGLLVNLKVNWLLLESTGTSTNVLSKALYDLVGHKSKNVRTRQIAAAIGYVGTEFAKEAPYYLGAFGATLLSDSISAKEAIIFLGGANLGAAVYEYGLARAMRTLLHRSNNAA